MHKPVTATLLTTLTAAALLAGCTNKNPNPNQPPVPTTAATETNGNNTKLTIPADLVGKNAQLADDELRKTGFDNIKYGSQNTDQSVDTAHLADWTVAKVEPTPGSTAQSNDNIVVTVVKK